MPLNKKPLPLEADPQSVRVAREWVSELLSNLGRDDLVDSAELGVSELVTNAVLHAEGPITLRVRGTRAHPRIEVFDHSQNPPEVNVEMTDDENLLSTIGRGLGIVAMYSSTWGSEVAADGKTVWFEPTTDLRTDGNLAGMVYDLDEELEDLPSGIVEPSQMVRIRLLDLPVQVFEQFRRRYRELRRELRLLSLAHGDDYPVARDFTEVSARAERERRQIQGLEKLDEAVDAGLVRVDLDYRVPPSTPNTMERLQVLLDKADKFCREQRLLVLSASPQQQALQRWYFSEFARQAAGEPPHPWPGGFTIDEPAPALS